MNILLDAYLDQNFGDDLFVETIVEMFPECRFYVFLEYFPGKVCDWAARFPNLYQLPECGVFLEKDMFDAYICVGGDIFPDGGDFRKRKEYTAALHRCGGTVAFLGFNLFREYSADTQRDICEIMDRADMIAPRDEESAELLRQWIPGIRIKTMPDLAFASEWKAYRDKCEKLLGVSVRRLSADKGNEEKYCESMAEMIDGYLKEDADRSVVLLCLSDGFFADRETAEKIMAILQEPGRVTVQTYQGDIAAYKRILGQCGAMVCTRFHALVACIAMEIPFLPVIYEVKQERILQSIGYDGAGFYYNELEGAHTALERLPGRRMESGPMERYPEQVAESVEEFRRMLYAGQKDRTVCRQGQTEAVCREKQYGRQQAHQVAQKSEELYRMAAEFKGAQETIGQCQKIIAQYMKAIESCNQTNGEYFRLIEELNQKICYLEAKERQRAEEFFAEAEGGHGEMGEDVSASDGK